MLSGLLMLAIPLLGALAIAFAPVSRAKWIALVASTLVFLVSVVAALRFEHWGGGFGLDFLELSHLVLEVPHAFTQSARQLRQPACTKDDENDEEDDDQLRWTYST